MPEATTFPPDELDDVAIGVSRASGGNGVHLDPVAKEAAVAQGKPLATFRVRRPRSEPPEFVDLRIYAKSMGQMDRVEAARVAYFDALSAYQAGISSGWRIWRRRRRAVQKAMARVTEARFVWINTILSDPFDDEKHQEVDPLIFAALGYDVFCQILSVHTQGLDPEDMLRAMDPDYEEKKTARRSRGPSPGGLPTS